MIWTLIPDKVSKFNLLMVHNNKSKIKQHDIAKKTVALSRQRGQKHAAWHKQVTISRSKVLA